MSIAFWTSILRKNEINVISVPEGFVLNLQQAALEKGDYAKVWCKAPSADGEIANALLCTLREGSCDQQMLQLVFGEDNDDDNEDNEGENKVKFSIESNSPDAIVHLSGYFQPGPSDFDMNDEHLMNMTGGCSTGYCDDKYDDDDNDEDYETNELYDKMYNSKNGLMQIDNVYDDENDDSSSDDDDDDEDEDFVKEMQKKVGIKNNNNSNSKSRSSDKNKTSSKNKKTKPSKASTKDKKVKKSKK